jgi:aspartate ammonia-lyase
VGQFQESEDMKTADPIDRTAIQALLEHVPQIAELEAADRATLATLAAPRAYTFSERLFHEATRRRWFGVVTQGMVELVRGPEGHAHHVAVVGPGGCLGEGLFLDDLPHTVSAIALADTTVLQVPAAEIQRLRAERPALFSRLAHGFALSAAERLRARAEDLAGAGQSAGIPPAQ